MHVTPLCAKENFTFNPYLYFKSFANSPVYYYRDYLSIGNANLHLDARRMNVRWKTPSLFVSSFFFFDNGQLQLHLCTRTFIWEIFILRYTWFVHYSRIFRGIKRLNLATFYCTYYHQRAVRILLQSSQKLVSDVNESNERCI